MTVALTGFIAGFNSIEARNSVASFISAAIAVRALIRYVSGHNFKIFAWYRIAFGFIILGTWYFGVVKW